jgi:hypothetical protein
MNVCQQKIESRETQCHDLDAARYLSAAGFRSEGEYCQNGRRCKNQRYVVHNHGCHLK